MKDTLFYFIFFRVYLYNNKINFFHINKILVTIIETTDNQIIRNSTVISIPVKKGLFQIEFKKIKSTGKKKVIFYFYIF